MLPTRQAFVYLLYIVSLKQPVQNTSQRKNGKTEHGHYPHTHALSLATTYEENRLAPWRMFYDTVCCQGKQAFKPFQISLTCSPKRQS